MWLQPVKKLSYRISGYYSGFGDCSLKFIRPGKRMFGYMAAAFELLYERFQVFLFKSDSGFEGSRDTFKIGTQLFKVFYVGVVVADFTAQGLNAFLLAIQYPYFCLHLYISLGERYAGVMGLSQFRISRGYI